MVQNKNKQKTCGSFFSLINTEQVYNCKKNKIVVKKLCFFVFFLYVDGMASAIIAPQSASRSARMLPAYDFLCGLTSRFAAQLKGPRAREVLTASAGVQGAWFFWRGGGCGD